MTHSRELSTKRVITSKIYAHLRLIRISDFSPKTAIKANTGLGCSVFS